MTARGYFMHSEIFSGRRDAQRSFARRVGARLLRAPLLGVSALALMIGAASAMADAMGPGAALLGLRGSDAPATFADTLSREPQPTSRALDMPLLRDAPSPEDVVARRLVDIAGTNAALSRDIIDLSMSLERFTTTVEATFDSLSAGAETDFITLSDALGPRFAEVEGPLGDLPHMTVRSRAVLDFSVTTTGLLERVRSIPRAPEQERPLALDLPPRALPAATMALVNQFEPDSDMASAFLNRQRQPRTRLDEARFDLEDMTSEFNTLLTTVAWDRRYITVDAALLLGHEKLVAAHGLIYEKDLARFADAAQAFPKADHQVALAHLSGGLQDLRRRGRWDELRDSLARRHAHHTDQANSVAEAFGHPIVLAESELMGRQRGICVEAAAFGGDGGMVSRLIIPVELTYDQVGGLPVTSLREGPVVWQPLTDAQAEDGYRPACVAATMSGNAFVDIRGAMTDQAREIVAELSFRMGQISSLAAHHAAVSALITRATSIQGLIEARREQIDTEPKAIARYAHDIECAPNRRRRFPGTGVLVVDVDVDPDGDIDRAQVVNAEQFQTRSRNLERDLERVVQCSEYEPRRIDDRDVLARKRLTITVESES